MSAVLGVDGTRRGWVAARLEVDDPSGRSARWLDLADIADALTADVDAIGVDMPIGLPARGRRACDQLAKQRLGKAHPRVFLAPPRAVLAATSYDDAAVRHRALADGLGLSVQTWQLVPKIREVDRVAGDVRLVEVHPELSFALIAGTVLPSKHRPEGLLARLQAVRQQWPALPQPPAGHDGLDALAAAWSAQRWLLGTAVTLPAHPPLDELRRPMQIVV